MKIIFPPRPKSKITPGSLGKYEATGKWLVQRKFNGTRNLIHVSPERKVSMFGRHGEPHKQFKASGSLKKEVLSLNLQDGKEYWLDSELLSYKTKSQEYKDKIVLFDVLQAGRYLYRRPDQIGRIEILKDVCNNPKDLESGGLALQVTENIFLAQSFFQGFRHEFERFIDRDEIEGLVLRKSNSVLENSGIREYSIPWQVRCRKPHKNYSF
jgi:ATP-dependent DNA ligase